MQQICFRSITVSVLYLLLVGCGTQQESNVPRSVPNAAQHATKSTQPPVRRFGQFARLRPEKIDEYKRLHAEIWPEVAQGLTEYHIQNYSIWLKELEPGQPYLFGYFEYTGDDFDADMERMNEDATMRKWERAAGDECLLKLSPDDDSWWVDMEEVFYDAAAVDLDVDPARVQRFGQVIGLRPELVDSYKYIHKHAWPEVLAAIRRGKIRNYPIYMARIGEKHYLFGYFEYVGDDLNSDMATVDSDPATKAWVKFTDEVCQLPIPTREEGEWWAMMENVFYQP